MNEYEDQYKLCKDDNDCSNEDQCGTIIMNPNNNVLNYDTFLYSLIQVFFLKKDVPNLYS
jgi:hypothetical protein